LQGNTREVKPGTFVSARRSNYFYHNSRKRPNKFSKVEKQENLTHMNESAIAPNLQGNTREVKPGTFVSARRSNYFYHNKAQNLNPISHLELDSMPTAQHMNVNFWVLFLNFTVMLNCVASFRF